MPRQGAPRLLTLTLALCAVGACAQERRLTLWVAETASGDAGLDDASPVPPGAWCRTVGGALTREEARRELYAPTPRHLCVAFVVEPLTRDGDWARDVQVHAIRTEHIDDRATGSAARACLGAAGDTLAADIADEPQHQVSVAVLDLDRLDADYPLAGPRLLASVDDLTDGPWCAPPFGCNHLFAPVQSRVVAACNDPRAPAVERCFLQLAGTGATCAIR